MEDDATTVTAITSLGRVAAPRGAEYPVLRLRVGEPRGECASSPRPIFDENMAAMTRLLDLIDQMPEEARQDIEAAGGATAQIARALGGAGAALQHLAKQLHERAGKIVGRDRNPWQNPDRLAKEWRRCFSQDPLASLTSDDQRSLRVGFARRHVLEHNGGRIDQKYLDETGDSGLVGRRLRIRAPFVREFFASVIRFAVNLEAGAGTQPITSQQSRTGAFRRRSIPSSSTPSTRSPRGARSRPPGRMGR